MEQVLGQHFESESDHYRKNRWNKPGGSSEVTKRCPLSDSPVIILCLALLVIVWWAVKIQANRNKTDIQEEGQEKKKGMFRRRKDK